MRTNVHWAMKSQQPFTVTWTIEMRNNIDCESIWTWTGSASRRSYITDNKKKKFLQIELLLTWIMASSKSLTMVAVDRM